MQALQTTELSWAKKLMKEGVDKGLLEGMRKSLLVQLTYKFGELPSDFVKQLNAIKDQELLSAIMIQGLTVQSLDEITLDEITLTAIRV